MGEELPPSALIAGGLETIRAPLPVDGKDGCRPRAGAIDSLVGAAAAGDVSASLSTSRRSFPLLKACMGGNETLATHCTSD
jgi:hypothetical protein